MEGQVKLYESKVIIDLGDVDVMFRKPTELERDDIELEIVGMGRTITAILNSKTLIGVLKALESGHERRKVYKKGEDRWKNSTE